MTAIPGTVGHLLASSFSLGVPMSLRTKPQASVSVSHSFFGDILTVDVQITIEPLSLSALDQLACKRKREHSPAEDPNAHDYGSEAQEPQTEGDEDG
jgi:hypothetical protein